MCIILFYIWNIVFLFVVSVVDFCIVFRIYCFFMVISVDSFDIYMYIYVYLVLFNYYGCVCE